MDSMNVKVMLAFKSWVHGERKCWRNNSRNSNENIISVRLFALLKKVFHLMIVNDELETTFPSASSYLSDLPDSGGAWSMFIWHNKTRDEWVVVFSLFEIKFRLVCWFPVQVAVHCLRIIVEGVTETVFVKCGLKIFKTYLYERNIC